MGKFLSKVQTPPGSPKETESPAGDAKYEGKTPRAPQYSSQGHAVSPNTQITVHNNSMDRCSSKRNETTTGSSQNHDIRPEDKIFRNKDYTHFNVNTNSAGDSKSFSSSKSTNETLQTITQVTELSIIDNDTGGNDITDQLDSGSVSHNNSGTASCPIVQTANSENDEQTIPMAKEDKKETKKEKKKKKKKRCITPVNMDRCSSKRNETTTGSSQNHDIRPEDKIFGNKDYTHFNVNTNSAGDSKRPESPKPMKAGTTEQGDSGVKDKMRQKPSEPIKTGCWLPQEENTGVKNKMRPSKPMKAGKTVDLFKQDETGVKDKMSVSEQQVKTMTMEAERLAEHCRFNIEMSKTDDEELILCPKAFIQSISSVEKHISNLTWENSKLVMEKNEYLNRLSSAAAARLIDNNSNITNLNDPNRPMKLADKFNKIYDDEWTDMIEKLEKKGHKTEEHKDKCVYHLYSVLIVIVNSLSKKAEVQLQGLAEHLFLLTKPSTEQIDATWYEYKEERVQLIASRKKTAETTILMLHQTLQTDTIFLQELCECSPPLEDVMLSDILHSEYFMKCVEICWYFVIQDPPMYVENVSLKGRKIDKDTHKVYTKSGDIVKYHVWPALYLHHQDGTNSPLMGKGVVQPE